MKKTLKKFIFPLIFCIIIWSALFFGRKGEPYYLLESFWLVGIIMILIGLLLWVNNEGVFNIMTWGVGKVTDWFRKVPKNTLKYIEYVEFKRDSHKITVLPTIIIGSLFFVVGLVWWLIIA